jgi:Flp pilus assembly protein TadG
MNTPVRCPAVRSRERGMVLVYVAILSLVMIGLVGLALDGALVASTAQQLQHGADAAALNAVRYVDLDTDPFPVTRAAALSVALANQAAKVTIKLDANAANTATGDVIVGYWDAYARTFTPTTTTPNAVRVHARRTDDNVDGKLSLLFAPVFGTNASNVGVISTAVLAPPPPALVLILDPTGNDALRINGTNFLFVPSGRIHANSTSACGISLVGTPSMVALRTTVVGGACYPSGTITGGPVIEDSDVVADPLASTLPTVATWNAFKVGMPKPLGANGQITTGGTYSPGYYPKGLDVTSTAVVNLQPGSYMFGADVKLGGSAMVYGSGVTLFFDKDAKLDISGSGAGMQVQAPGSSSPFYGVAMFFHRQTTGGSVAKIGGGGSFKVEGVAYVPNGELVMAGTPGKELGGIIAFRASTAGTTGFTVTGKGVPPWPSGPKTAFLVE